MKHLVILGVAFALAACAVHKEAMLPSPPVPVAPAPLTSAPVQPGFETVPADEAADPDDMCGSAKLKYLVGRLKSEIPVPLDPSLRRVTCTSCPVTMDFNPRRLNILYDQASGIVKEVKCG